MNEARSALVTGSSTGIGRATALQLARSGFHVFAGVRKEADGESLLAAAGDAPLEPVILDVTDPDQIAAAAERIADVSGSAGLAALVNNAGVAYPGPLELLPLDDFRAQLEVNLIGQVAVTQSMLPLLRAYTAHRRRGRIVNVTSIGGLVASPFFSPYIASKFALGGVSDCLRVELAPWGIKTIAVAPGSIATEIWGRGATNFERATEDFDREGLGLYGDAIQAVEKVSEETGARGIAPEKVALVIHRALSVRWPRARYLVGPDAHGMYLGRRLLGARLWDRAVRSGMKLP